MKKILLPVLLIGTYTLSAQQFQHGGQIDRCASYEYQQQQFAADPQYQARVNMMEAQYDQYMLTNPNPNPNRIVVTIPVVVHVVYANATENISTTRIQEQIQVLNDDYRKTNSDASLIPSAWTSIAADCEIQFCLAARDPQGNWTDGIHRVSTTTSSFSTNDNVKYTSSGGTDAWDRSKYLNLWVCDLGSSLLGYAQFPGGAAATDGVVLHYRYTGKTGASAPYNKGRTATHEVGHWLGLRHIWGDDGTSCNGSDLVSDTPNQADEHYGCPSGVQISCTNSPNGDMWMNYMDYTDDACMYMFTAGQKTRMWFYLNGSRVSLQTSNGCIPVGIEEQGLAKSFNLYPSPTDGLVTLDFGGLEKGDYDVTVYNTLGDQVAAMHIDALNERIYSLDLRSQSAGIYFVEVRSKTDKVVKRVIVQ